MLVATYMTRHPVTITPRDLLGDAERKMRSGGFRRLPVVDGEWLVGIVSDRDLKAHNGHLDQTRVTAAMTENPVTVTSTTLLREAARRMLDYKIDSLPVLEDGKLVGIVTTSDVLKAFLDSGANEFAPAKAR